MFVIKTKIGTYAYLHGDKKEISAAYSFGVNVCYTKEQVLFIKENFKEWWKNNDCVTHELIVGKVVKF